MKRFLTGLGVVFGLFVVVAVMLIAWFIGTYNAINGAEENVDKTWGQVENVYQRRADLVPNLVNTVKGYAAHEKEVLIAVTEARAKVGQLKIDGIGNNVELQKNFMEAQTGMSSALSRLMVVVEKYPDLKADGLFSKLMDELSGTENRISVERMRNQEAVGTYNVKIRKFPGNIIASIYGFEERPYFVAEKGAEKAPEVKF